MIINVHPRDCKRCPSTLQLLHVWSLGLVDVADEHVAAP